eukprot:gnl/Spiro4/29223_TR14293_c0_g1_i1.p1 gnl/Spiro4/29223_TR14293_c0_g1~~gnl/Spiro4/29223_TR14293_c0_g1_i1.p1  ORF type:complete len:657 (+),score=-29.84 gnl/Spiro4/29223_TR14293_c0_g1_i1:112-1971(+)
MASGGFDGFKFDFQGDNEGEAIKVALRVRPMNSMEQARGDENCIKIVNDTSCQVSIKGQIKHFTFNMCLPERTNQTEAFNRCGVSQLIDSALDGYSATILAYGQTGSGKTYTMSGVEEKLGRDVYISDDTEGIIPRAFRYMWSNMIKRQDQFYVKASFMEIYNEQVRDILNPVSGILHTRWNVKNGFFVEDLMVVECSNVDDLVAVLHEGMKNRRTGSHELNKDSSRSHSILTVYIISESMSQQGQPVRKYGKISFVDLAGSERLKESKSHGDMIKETGNINRSLFVLGKVISGLSDKKSKQPYIPYRDSKLTMLLMDSLGGTSKSLMIACISPSYVYLEETLSTLNYATRTMNIKNKPVIQMDPKEQIIFNLNRENELLRMENMYLREQLQRVTQGLPIEMPDFLPGGGNNGGKKSLPPLQSANKNASSSKKLIPSTDDSDYQVEMPVNKMMGEYQYEVTRLKKENEELRYSRDIAEKNYHILMNDNNALQIKLENLENVFIGNPIQKGDNSNKPRNRIEDEFMISTLMNENTSLKNRIKELEEKNIELEVLARDNPINFDKMNKKTPVDQNEIFNLRQVNTRLQERVEFLQQRERDLMGSMNRGRNSGNGESSGNGY